MTTFIAIANHYWNIPSLKHQMGKDSVSGASMKTRTHSQAPARKRNRKGSWGGLNTLGLARTNSSANEISFIVSEKFREQQNNITESTKLLSYSLRSSFSSSSSDCFIYVWTQQIICLHLTPSLASSSVTPAFCMLFFSSEVFLRPVYPIPSFAHV